MSSGMKKGGKSKVKEEDNLDYDDDDFVDTKPKIKQQPQDDDFQDNKPTTTSNKRKRVKKEEEMEVKFENNGGGKKREKKSFTLPGQKRDPPDERDPLRIFYQTLYEQVPTSEMAAFWMMESGLLPFEKAYEVFQKKLQMKQQQKLASPMKAVVTVKKESGSVKRNIMSSAEQTTTKKSIGTVKSSKMGKSDDNQTDNQSDDDFASPVDKGKKPRAGKKSKAT
ncbi:transcriptional regulator ATRX-like [Heracleum sosnowskyi]|uniref:Transcriptional regulator ATRX-like n=1 Tax=Heracleum sosnowskyi TaxID=360622 RepID=A0AAD8H874_9APIA|nr:transcriptional regulator ATRX-like [Heracleum sosnowskyi]